MLYNTVQGKKATLGSASTKCVYTCILLCGFRVRCDVLLHMRSRGYDGKSPDGALNVTK